MISMSRRATLLAGAFTMLAAWPHGAAAQGYTIGHLQIGHPWTRATPPGAQAAGGFMRLTNSGTEQDRLIRATFTAAPHVELHEMAHVNGVMTMRELPGGIVIAPGATVTLEPGGLHVMFLGLTRRLTEGERVEGTLTFERAGTVTVQYKVEAMGARGGHGHHSQGHGAGQSGGHRGGHGHHGAARP